jgi:hypothetical protein
VAAKFPGQGRPAEDAAHPAQRGDAGEARLWHIGVALAVSFTVAVAALAGLAGLAWVLLGAGGFRRHGAPPLHDTVSVAQLVFASVAGAGALVALVVAYRRQKVAEADSAHDRARVLNERFTAIAAQLGDAQPAVRLAGVHAMAGLADDWRANRQTCIDVLCAHLRMPYEPDPGEGAPAAERLALRAGREVRHTVIRVITAHLQRDAAVSWRGCNFDFTGIIFDGGTFTVAGAPRLARLGEEPDTGEARVLAVVDAAVDARLTRPAPSQEAAVLAWAGGLAHARQVDRALGILSATRTDGDPDVRRRAGLARLADPASPRVAAQVIVELGAGQRRALAAAVLEEALAITGDAGCGLVERSAALLAAYRVRRDLASRDRLPRAQHELVAALEALGDYATASEVATTAVREWPPGANDLDDRDALEATVLRLSRLAPGPFPGPLAGQLIADTVAGGAVTGLEARVWAAAILLGTPGQREPALELVGRVIADLDARPDHGEAGDLWRLLLGRHLARAGQDGLAGQALAPLLASDDPAWHRPARAILEAGTGREPTSAAEHPSHRAARRPAALGGG